VYKFFSEALGSIICSSIDVSLSSPLRNKIWRIFQPGLLLCLWISLMLREEWLKVFSAAPDIYWIIWRTTGAVV